MYAAKPTRSKIRSTRGVRKRGRRISRSHPSGPSIVSEHVSATVSICGMRSPLRSAATQEDLADPHDRPRASSAARAEPESPAVLTSAIRDRDLFSGGDRTRRAEHELGKSVIGDDLGIRSGVVVAHRPETQCERRAALPFEAVVADDGRLDGAPLSARDHERGAADDLGARRDRLGGEEAASLRRSLPDLDAWRLWHGRNLPFAPCHRADGDVPDAARSTYLTAAGSASG